MLDTKINASHRKKLLLRFWSSARGFWNIRQGDRHALWMSMGLLILILAQLGFNYGINIWNRSLFDAVEGKDQASVLHLTLIFIPLVIGALLFGVAQVATRMSLQRRWRAWLTARMTSRWLADNRYYQLNFASGSHQNPEYRLADDLRIATDAPIDFVAGIVSAFLSAMTFIAVLWTIGGQVTFSILSISITIHGFLVVAAVLYAVITSSVMIIIGRRFVTIVERKNQAEAEYRYSLTRVRENSESIALLGGAKEEREGLDRSLSAVIHHWSLLAGQHVRATVVSQGSSLIVPIVPLLLCSPKYLEGNMTLGQMMQAASAFAFVQGAFGWLVDNYPRFADWTANASRVASLMVSLDRLEAEGAEADNRIRHKVTIGSTAVSLENVSVALDDGKVVLSEFSLSVGHGDRVLIDGESGAGKSTLVRAIAGLWPWGRGNVGVSPGRLLLLPQKSYLPSGTLGRAVAYPEAPNRWPRSQLCNALAKVGLMHLQSQLDCDLPWDQILSGGEKQRLAFARLLLHRPDIIVLDEATSALDAPSQRRMMQLLQVEMGHATIISIGHRADLSAYHSRRVTIGAQRSDRLALSVAAP